MKKKMILVTGAAGALGSGVARALLAEKNFTIRILTQNPESQNTIDLKTAGAELVEGNLGDIAGLIQIMKDCHGVFGVTGLGVHYEKEYQLGLNLLKAAKLSDIPHLVLHTHPDYAGLSKGKYPVPQYDIKAALRRYCMDLHLPATFVQTGFFYEDFMNLFLPRKSNDGSFYFGFPMGDAKLPMSSVEDVGGIVSMVFNHPAEYTGRTVTVVGSEESGHGYAVKMSKVFHKDIKYQKISRETYIGRGLPGMVELANRFEVHRLFIPEMELNLIESYGLNPRMQTFQNWLLKNREKFASQFNRDPAHLDIETRNADSAGVH